MSIVVEMLDYAQSIMDVAFWSLETVISHHRRTGRRVLGKNGMSFAVKMSHAHL